MDTQRDGFEGERRPLWGAPKGVEAVLHQWRNGKVWRDVVLDDIVHSRAPSYGAIPDELAPGLVAALKGRGIEQLYTHQADALNAVLDGHDVVVATPTASGKSLCYNLPVLDCLSSEPEARALYMFPTKALSRDQEESLRGLMGEAGLLHPPPLPQ